MFNAAWAGAGVVIKPILLVVGFVILIRLVAQIVKMRRG